VAAGVDLEAVVHPVAGKASAPRRWLQHLTTPPWALRRSFPPSTLTAIDAACAASERTHRAEIRCAVETVLSLDQLWRGVSSAERAVEVFAQLHMWDTAENNGVLLYVLLAERKIEIVADRGFSEYVAAAQWRGICTEMEAAFGTGQYEAGALAAMDRIGAIARQHFPLRDGDRNELPNTTVLL
jgi:uncharacterized membrane protein YgcG